MSFRNAKGGYIRPGYDPLEVSNPPTSAAATAGSASASVSFTAPTNVGGSAITNYYAVSNPGQITASSVTSPIAVSGLSNGTEYTFKVWGENSYGPSAYSAPTGAVTPSPPYIEDVFSTYLYTGNGSTQTITNGIDLAGEGGLTWFKERNGSTWGHALFSGIGGYLRSQSTDALSTNTTSVINTTSGFNLTDGGARWNANATTYASWTFRKAEKFFDVVTWTGNNTSERAIPHNLGSVPGCIIVKAYTGSFADLINWIVYHRSAGTSSGYPQYLKLNGTDGATPSTTIWGSTAFTSTNFYIGSDDEINNSNKTYVAYLFAHDAGGFGASGSDNVISCGSFTTDGSGNADINLGYEAQFVMLKSSQYASNWIIEDNMRGLNLTQSALLLPNTSDAEINGTATVRATATGFATINGQLISNATYIYIAIRRGPMKTPTSGTSVFSPNAITGNALVTTNFPVDSAWLRTRGEGDATSITDRLRGSSQNYYNNLQTSSTAAENTGTGAGLGFDNNTGYQINAFTGGSASNITWNFRRAPGFFDVVCYTGTASASLNTITHNLGVIPELIIIKQRSGTLAWAVMHTFSATDISIQTLNDATAEFRNTYANVGWLTQKPTSTQFILDDISSRVNSAGTYVAYLFATCAGVSKVGSYTGTGTTLQVNCGFTGGARFVLIKRTDSTGDWYVWDSARGIVAGNDPYLLLNSTAAEVTNTDYVDTYSAGFEISSTAPAAINANGGTFIYLAIA